MDTNEGFQVGGALIGQYVRTDLSGSYWDDELSWLRYVCKYFLKDICHVDVSHTQLFYNSFNFYNKNFIQNKGRKN